MIITVYDGAGCVGGNKIHLECEGRGLLLDFGLNYGHMSKYYESFIAPRGGRGLHDYLSMGLVPHLDIYRREYVVSDVDLGAAQRVPLDALLISHAHMDHIGMAGLLREDVPFVCSPMTAALIKAMNDVNRFHIASNCIRCPQDRMDPDDGRVIARRGARTRYNSRRYCLTERGNEPLRELWEDDLGRGEGQRSQGLEDMACLGLEIKAFPVDHSIYGASAFAVNSEAGWAVYTGDIRLHGRFQERSRQFVEEARRLSPRALIVEGTRVEREGDAEVTEEEVRENCLRASDGVDGLVVADFGPRNIERLDTFIEIASELGRKLVVTKKDAYLLDAVSRVDGADRMRDVHIFDRVRTDEAGAEERAAHDHQDGLLDPREIAAAPRDHLLCFSYPDMNDLLDVAPSGGVYIYSSSEAYTEESVFDFQRLWNWIRYFDMEAVGFTMGRDGPSFTKGYHASGHLSAEDLAKVLERIGAEKVIPVHTAHPERFRSIVHNVIVPEKGVGIELR